MPRTCCFMASLGARCDRFSAVVRFARFSSKRMVSSTCLRNWYSMAAVSTSPVGAAVGVSPKDNGRARPASCATRSSSLCSQRSKILHSLYNGCSSGAGRAKRAPCDEFPSAFMVYDRPPRLIDRNGAASRSRWVCLVASRWSRLAFS